MSLSTRKRRMILQAHSWDCDAKAPKEQPTITPVHLEQIAVQHRSRCGLLVLQGLDGSNAKDK